MNALVLMYEYIVYLLQAILFTDVAQLNPGKLL